jgi:hypothetical protein
VIVFEILGIITAISLFATAIFGGFEHTPPVKEKQVMSQQTTTHDQGEK